MNPHPAKFTIRLTVCAAALLLSNRFCFAVDCPNDVQVTLMNEETLAHVYQPADGDILHRYRFVPPTPYGPTYPTVLMLPPDIFKLEYGDNGNPTERVVSYDLQQAACWSFRLSTVLRLWGHSLVRRLVALTTSAAFPIKPMTSNVRLWPRSPILSATATSILLVAPQVGPWSCG